METMAINSKGTSFGAERVVKSGPFSQPVEKNSSTMQNPPSSSLYPNVLTPPSSPGRSPSSSKTTSDTEVLLEKTRTEADQEQITGLCSGINRSSYDRDTDEVLIGRFEVEIQKDTIGHGAWSIVFRGTCHQRATSGLETPPLSGRRRPLPLVAVKKPARRDAIPIIQSEAQVLSHLMDQPDNERYIVQFYGTLSESASLVLEFMPYTLEEHIKKSAVAAQNTTEPVVGSISIWLGLTHKLVSALSWLHNQAMIVHGDLKPSNILMDDPFCDEYSQTDDPFRNECSQMNDPFCDECSQMAGDPSGFPYKVRLADFSSSQKLDGEPVLNTLSAVTREYTAPELLSSKVLSDPRSTATTASDVFSLAITLLVAATGNTMVYTGSMFQRQAMATQGWMAIQLIRNGPVKEGARVPRGGVVERTLNKVVLQEGKGRIGAARWLSLIESMLERQPTGS